MYYNVIKHSGHLGTLEKCRKHSPAARVFYISLVFSNARRVLSQCNTRLRLLYLLNIRNCSTNQIAGNSLFSSEIILIVNIKNIFSQSHEKIPLKAFFSEVCLLDKVLMDRINLILCLSNHLVVHNRVYNEQHLLTLRS